MRNQGIFCDLLRIAVRLEEKGQVISRYTVVTKVFRRYPILFGVEVALPKLASREVILCKAPFSLFFMSPLLSLL